MTLRTVVSVSLALLVPVGAYLLWGTPPPIDRTHAGNSAPQDGSVPDWKSADLDGTWPVQGPPGKKYVIVISADGSFVVRGSVPEITGLWTTKLDVLVLRAQSPRSVTVNVPVAELRSGDYTVRPPLIP